MIYTDYVEEVLKLLDKTDVPKVFNMAYALTGVDEEIHGRALNQAILKGYVNNLTPEQVAEILEMAILEAFTEAFVENQDKH